jgi:tRNA(adenine34) deaminase
MTMTCQCDCTHGRLANRRSFIAGLACAAIFPTLANAQLAGPPSADDVRFMRMAIEEARLADFPFGAVIVRDGTVIARGRNLGRTNRDPTAHGEMDAIRKCLAEHGPAALRGSTLYTSGEPCAMCMGAILWCHVGRLVFAASVTQLASKIDQIMLSSAEVAAKAPFAPISITGGVLADEAMALFK